LPNLHNKFVQNPILLHVIYGWVKNFQNVLEILNNFVVITKSVLKYLRHLFRKTNTSI